jgi:hypothetical protein
LYPHERSLVERMKGKPFAIVGVNSDSDRERARKAVAAEKLAWRSFSDGDWGPIAQAWNVRGWPTIYVLDHEGVIRLKDAEVLIREDALDDAINGLVEEAEKAQRK